jgi:hypothetical protein
MTLEQNPIPVALGLVDARHTWQMIIEESSSDKSPPGVRRMAVPGGWLYQVESYELVAGTRTIVRVWHPPIYVPWSI